MHFNELSISNNQSAFDGNNNHNFILLSLGGLCNNYMTFAKATVCITVSKFRNQVKFVGVFL